MADPDAPKLSLDTVEAWREWLRDNHETSPGVWLVFWRRGSGREPLDYDECVREALCWGWIDGHTRVIDSDRRGMWFTRRGRNSGWSASNKARVALLTCGEPGTPEAWSPLPHLVPCAFIPCFALPRGSSRRS